MFVANARTAPSAATAGSGDDKFDRADSEEADRAREHSCVAPTTHRSIPHACLATVGLAHLSAASDENYGSRTAHWASVISIFSIYAVGHKFQLLSPLKVFMR